jgi:hypothetical protein
MLHIFSARRGMDGDPLAHLIYGGEGLAGDRRHASA